LALHALAVLLHHIAPVDDSTDGRGVGRWTADAEFLQFADEAGLGVARWCLRETLGGLNAVHAELLAHLHGWKQPLLILIRVLIVRVLHIHLEETIELDDLTLCHERLWNTRHTDVDGGAFQLGIGHLAGDGALPDELVEPLVLGTAPRLLLIHIGWTD